MFHVFGFPSEPQPMYNRTVAPVHQSTAQSTGRQRLAADKAEHSPEPLAENEGS